MDADCAHSPVQQTIKDTKNMKERDFMYSLADALTQSENSIAAEAFEIKDWPSPYLTGTNLWTRSPAKTSPV